MKIYEYKKTSSLIKAIANKLVNISHTLEADTINIALSGGSTPKGIFELLSTSEYINQVNWDKCHFWWGDERFVSDLSEDSNYGVACRLLFDKLPKKIINNLHPIKYCRSSKEASLNYRNELENNIRLEDGMPIFDWVILGMGDDGHTASLFMDDLALGSTQYTEVVNHQLTKQERVTLTLPVINSSKMISIIVSGEAKSNILSQVFSSSPSESRSKYPIEYIEAYNGSLEWCIDSSAASFCDFHQQANYTLYS
jgi:6-phosphogluconolactonase